MANTFELIESTTLGSAQSSVVIGSGNTIPQTYKDLVLYSSARSTFASTGDNLLYKMNALTSGYKQRVLYGTGSGSGGATAWTDPAFEDYVVGNNATSSTFSNTMLYFYDYTSSNLKNALVDSVTENNATATNMGLLAELQSDTGAITMITITSGNGGNIAANSSFYLYGVKNA